MSFCALAKTGGSHETVFIETALQPLRPWLDNHDVVEICANRPGEVWIEVAGGTEMERHAVPELSRAALRHLMERVAAFSGQSVNEEHPLLSAALPDGERFQGVLPPATTNGGAFAIRKQVVKDMRLQEYRKRGSFAAVDIGDPNALSATDIRLCEHLDAGEIESFIASSGVGRPMERSSQSASVLRPRSFMSSLKLVRRESGCSRRAALSCTKVPEPRRCTSTPSCTSSVKALRTVTRLTPSCSAASRSLGMASPGFSSLFEMAAVTSFFTRM